MVLDILLELLAYLGIIGLKKKKKKDKELKSPISNDSTPKQNRSEGALQEKVSVCAGCNRIIEKGAIYELEKTWCRDCYKSNVLKVQE